MVPALLIIDIYVLNSRTFIQLPIELSLIGIGLYVLYKKKIIVKLTLLKN